MKCVITGILAACWFLAACGSSLWAGTDAEPSEAAEQAARDEVFAGTKVFRLQIDIPRAGWESLRQTQWGNGQERPEARATVREGGKVYTNVAVHVKGAAGSFRPVDHDPALTLNFEKWAPGQSFHGLRKLSLNNSAQDRSYLAEKVCRELFEAAGVAVPRAGHAKLSLNGRDLGLRVLVEGANRQFLKRFFANTEGNLYDGGFLQDITDSLAVTTGAHPNDHTALKALVAAAEERELATRWTRLAQSLDVDRFLAYLAMDVMQCDWDGYAMNRNNWRLFHDRGANKMVFIPHGLDQMFGVERTSPECPILPPMQGLVARAVLAVPEGRRRYFETMARLYTNVFHAPALVQRVETLAALIRPVLAESSPQAAAQHDREVRWLKERITRRDESLKSQLEALANRPAMDANGVLRLAGWQRRVQSGNARFDEPRGANADANAQANAKAGASGSSGANALLYLAAPGGDMAASWRTRALVEPGRYRFDGRIRTKDVRVGNALGGGGAGLRISGGRLAGNFSGSQDWQDCSYSFQVGEDESQIELVCELRASRGEAWFDTASLKLVRLP